MHWRSRKKVFVGPVFSLSLQCTVFFLEPSGAEEDTENVDPSISGGMFPSEEELKGLSSLRHQITNKVTELHSKLPKVHFYYFRFDFMAQEIAKQPISFSCPCSTSKQSRIWLNTCKLSKIFRRLLPKNSCLIPCEFCIFAPFLSTSSLPGGLAVEIPLSIRFLSGACTR